MFCFAIIITNLHCLSICFHQNKEFKHLFIFLLALKSLVVSMQLLYFSVGEKIKAQNLKCGFVSVRCTGVAVTI